MSTLPRVTQPQELCRGGNPEKAASAVLFRDPRPAFLDPPALLQIDLPCLPVDQFGKEAREPVS